MPGHELIPMWQALLNEFSQTLISSQARTLTPENSASQWLGNSGATEAEIRAAETRLGVQFPPSYRAFLEVSNGWPRSDWTEMQLWSTTEINWFSQQNQGWIEAWRPYEEKRPTITDDEYFVYGAAQDCVNLRREYLQTALEISSDSGDGDIFLLIPDVIFPDGEWEAWHFGNKLPGAYRYQSFYNLMQEVVAQGCFIR